MTASMCRPRHTAEVHRASLPGVLGPVFSVREARDAGVTASRLRARDLAQPFHGVRAIPVAAAEDGRAERALARRAREYATRMGADAFFTHLTAAVLWGLPLPAGCLDTTVDVGMLTPGRAPRGRGVRGHEVAPHLASVREHPDLGVRIASPATTWAMLGAALRHPYDLVAVADHLVRVPRRPGGFATAAGPGPEPLATIAQLDAAVTAGRRVGIGALREALPRVREGVSSRRETWLRLIVVDAGLPEPVLDHDVFTDDGEFVACLDLAYPELKIGLEYDGDHHRTDAVQWAHDVDRLDRLAEEGWRIIRVTKTHIFTMPGVVVQRVRAAIEARARR